MNTKSARRKKSRTQLPPVDEHDDLTGAEKVFEVVKPHLATIGLVIVAGLLGFIAIAFLMRSRFDQQAIQWRELSNSSAIALRTGDITGLKDVANSYPDTKAGLWALQMAGDQQLRMGIEELGRDREAGIQLLKKAKENFEQIVNAPQSAKTTMLDRRSHFSLAYAAESLGELDEAKAIYETLISEAPDSAFAEPAKRGLARAANDKYEKLYAKFINFEEEFIGDAPGPSIPDRPNLSFPETNLEPGQKPPTTNQNDNDFVPGNSSDPAPGNNVSETPGKQPESSGDSETKSDDASDTSGKAQPESNSTEPSKSDKDDSDSSDAESSKSSDEDN